MVDDQGAAKPKHTGGRGAALIKTGIVKTSLWATSHPTIGMPKRKHRVTAEPRTLTAVRTPDTPAEIA